MTKRRGSSAEGFDDALRESLDYCEKTGALTWRLPPKRGIPSGSVAGSRTSNGYLSLSFRSVPLYAHRVVWFLKTAKWPAHVIDHINGDRLDNRFENLRDVSQRTNTQNVLVPRRHNRTGLLGVRVSGSRFVAQLAFAGRTLHLGSFACKEDAHAAYLMKKRELHGGNTL